MSEGDFARIWSGSEARRYHALLPMPGFIGFFVRKPSSDIQLFGRDSRA
jgi:hypothetical protein